MIQELVKMCSNIQDTRTTIKWRRIPISCLGMIHPYKCVHVHLCLVQTPLSEFECHTCHGGRIQFEEHLSRYASCPHTIKSPPFSRYLSVCLLDSYTPSATPVEVIRLFHNGTYPLQSLPEKVRDTLARRVTSHVEGKIHCRMCLLLLL